MFENVSSELLNLSAAQVISHMREGVMITDADHNILAVNEPFSTVTGYKSEDILGLNPRVLKSGEHKTPFYVKMWASIAKSGYWQGEIINKRKNGEFYTEWISISSVKNSDGHITHYMAVFTDITKKKRAEETIRHMAYYDALTDLPNRAMFRDQLKTAMAQAERHKEMLGVLFLDLDRVKVINDTLGHDMGDRLLKAVAERLLSCLRQTDVVARLGGDEFMLLITGVKQLKEIVALTEKILEAVRPSFHFDGKDLFTTASIGVSVFPNDGHDPETLLKNADTAMYRAKRGGRNNYQVFDPTMKAEVFQQLALDNGLRRALEQNEFVVHYQPQIDIESGRIVGMEALVRWDHPELGLLPPSTFIQWAEDSGLIIPIGERVLRMACAQNKKWQDSGHPTIKVGVNISGKQMRQSNIIETVRRILAETGLPPSCLDLELTESVLMDLYGQAMNIPHELKAMGVGFSIDDFGTGYSSLNYLKRLPVNTLKMDQSFVRDLTSDSNDAAIANAVIGLGHGLKLNVLAEGVETEGQLNHLRELSCDQVQGFFFSEPLSADNFENLLRSKKPLGNSHAELFSN
jgi:diguanylate cyclase (GGDEF)-like protein/PAS domain S-box-containing protein